MQRKRCRLPSFAITAFPSLITKDGCRGSNRRRIYFKAFLKGIKAIKGIKGIKDNSATLESILNYSIPSIPSVQFIVLSSSRGTTFQAVIDAMKNGSLTAKCLGLITDRPDRGCIAKAEAAGIPVKIIEKN